MQCQLNNDILIQLTKAEAEELCLFIRKGFYSNRNPIAAQIFNYLTHLLDLYI